jgi:hypothetical protein
MSPFCHLHYSRWQKFLFCLAQNISVEFVGAQKFVDAKFSKYLSVFLGACFTLQNSPKSPILGQKQAFLALFRAFSVGFSAGKKSIFQNLQKFICIIHNAKSFSKYDSQNICCYGATLPTFCPHLLFF